jgi:hypothetical protein
MVDELAYHIFIQATAQDVWDALTGPGLTRKYGYRTLVKCDPQPGGIYLAYASGRRYRQVISVGSAAPRYSAPGPARAELLAAVGG